MPDGKQKLLVKIRESVLIMDEQCGIIQIVQACRQRLRIKRHQRVMGFMGQTIIFFDIANRKGHGEILLSNVAVIATA
jgi:hypothetical protein